MFEEEPPQPNQRRRPLCLIIALMAMILLPLESITRANKPESTLDLIFQKLRNKTETEQQLATTDLGELLGTLDNTDYEGKWIATDTQKNTLLGNAEGRLQIGFQKVYAGNGIALAAQLKLFRMYYSDDGLVEIGLKPTIYGLTERYTQGRYEVALKEPVAQPYLTKMRLSVTQGSALLNITALNISLSLAEGKDQLRFSVAMQSDKQSFESGWTTKAPSGIPNYLLALVVTVASTLQLVAIFKIFNRIMTGAESGDRYSLVTFLLFTCWDLTITVLCFTMCFQNERYFMVYLVPTFIASMLFSIFQSRLVMVIYGSDRELNHGNSLRFNLLLYGMFIATYFVVGYANMSTLFLLSMPLMILPQLYLNAYRGNTVQFDSNLASLYASRFLVLLYFRGYARNIFQLEPSATFCIELIVILGCMLGLMYAQAKYGTRSFFPKFLLPKSFEYFEEMDHSANIEVGVPREECAICLAPLHIAPQNEQHLTGEFVGKVMKTPCNHRFHGSCLVSWMQHKMDCPICRSKLPPY